MAEILLGRIKGDQGEKGEKGDPFEFEDFTPEQLESLTPKKGTDYYTPEEVESMIEDILSRIENGDFGSY